MPTTPTSISLTAVIVVITLVSKINITLSYSFNDQDYSCYHANSWMENVNRSRNSIFTSYTDIVKSHYLSGSRRRLHGNMPPASPSKIVTQSASSKLSTGWQIEFKGIPSYAHTMTAADITTLTSRPKASTDFMGGYTTAVAGNTYEWGADINYHSDECGRGYWPPGPVCPVGGSRLTVYPVMPKPEIKADGCYTGTAMGYFVNGIPFWSWSDTHTYSTSGQWYQVAMKWEKYDLDFCLGHAAKGEYHHHAYSPCLAEQLNDDGTGHSPIYGFAFDGYPVFGPYQAASTLAQSCWLTRDYSDVTKGGCSSGQRTCTLVDPFDYTKGTEPATITGPSFTSTQTTQSGNSITASNGVYFEDYYYDADCSTHGAEYLDAYNGHDHGDGMGYHYHVTVDGNKDPVFPYVIGPKYYGCLPSGSQLKCGLSFKYNAGAGTSDYSSVCGTSTAMDLANQQCLDHSFDITSSSSTGDGRLLPPAGRLGVLIGIIVVLLILVGLGLYCCCGKADDGANYKTVPVQSTWNNQNEYELQAYDNH